MTAALASFIQSPTGRFYGQVCAATGVDPGAAFDDDVIAFQVRAAYVLRETKADAQPAGSGVVTDLATQMRALDGR